MLETHISSLRIMLVASLATTANAMDWDDFTNNMATDLTPLIALFGEQATKQFLSESTTFLDNFIFAMAPLGILTGVVSAIRVCGGPSVRAFIGRAQEGGGIAEAELCSSTSRDVCELYHNGAIVRVFGRPKILEIVYDPTLEAKEPGDNKHEFGINISREYFQNTIRNETSWEEKGEKRAQQDAEGGSSPTKDTSNNFAPNPNLSLNIGIVKRSQHVYIGAAIIGFIAQASVLVLSAIITYKLHWKKNDNPIDPWAFPFVFAGTTCVCFGMFLCATLVNDSTKEREFKKNFLPSPMLYVVQPGNQVVGDQTFDPFLFSKTTDHYVTSWKPPSPSDSNSTSQNSSNSSQQGGISFKHLKKPSADLLVLIATFITTLGFALQFVGLRAMHSAVSLLQLGVTILMSIIRALLRTQRLSLEGNVLRDRPDEVSGHELDWLALQIGKNANDPRYFWSVTAKIPAQDFQSASESDDNKAWKYRSRLAELTGQLAYAKSSLSNIWHNDLVSGRLQAQQLKKAIEDSIAIFIEHAKVKENIAHPLQWNLNVAVGEYGELPDQPPNPDYQSVTVQLKQQGTNWIVDQNLLEAIIGLWSWSIISDPRTEEEAFGLKTSTALVRPMYRVIAAGAEDEVRRAGREIQYWMGSHNIPLSRFTKTTRSSNGSDANSTSSRQGKFIMVDGSDSSTQIPMSDPYQRLFGWHGTDVCNRPIIEAATVKSKLIPSLCSQDVYQSFLCAMTAYFDLHKGKTTVTRKEKALRLEHPVVTKLIDCFEASSLGSRQDAFLVIIPALRNHSSLPRATEAIPTAYKAAEDLRKSNNFQEAEGVLQWALGILSELGKPREAAMVELGELYRYALFSNDWKDFGKEGIKWMNTQQGLSVSSTETEVITRYVQLEKRPRESRTGQQVLGAILRNEREEALWSISQLDGSDRDLLANKESGRNVLSLSSEKGWLELVKAALEIGSVVDSVDKQGRTPLSYAAEHGHVSIVSTLMEAGALPITEDSSLRTPLSYAAGGGQLSVMEKLLSDPRVSPLSRDAQNRSPLHWAARNGFLVAVEYFVDRGAKVNIKDIQNRSPLHLAAENGHHDTINFLVDHGALVDDVDSNKLTPLLAALLNTRRSRFDRRKTANLLVQMKSKLDFTIQNKEIWEWALENGEFICAEFVLENDSRKNMGVVVDVIAAAGHPRQETFPLPLDFQPGFKIRFWIDEVEEKEITSKNILAIVRQDFAMRIRHITDDLRERQIDVSKRYKIIHMLLEGLQDTDAIEKLFVTATETTNGKELLTILLDQYEAQFQITEAVVKAAAGYWKGKQMLELPLDRRGDQVPIPEDVFEAAAGNRKGKQMLELLFDRRGDQVPIPEEVVKAAAAGGDQDILELLLNQRGDQVPITEDVVKAAAGNRKGKQMLELLFDRRGDQVPIPEEVVKAAAAGGDQDILELLLNQRGDQVPITEDVVKAAAAWGDQGKGILELLFNRRGDQVPITEDVVKAAVKNSNQGKDILELLFNRRGDQVPITEDAVKAAANNRKGKQMLELLFDQRKNQVPITEDIVKAAAANNWAGEDMLKLLLDRRGDQVPITEEVVKAAAANQRQGQEIIKLLLNRRGDQVTITEDVVKAAAAVCGKDTLEVLLDRRGDQVPITEEVVKAAAANWRQGQEIIKLLLDRRGDQVPITEDVFKAAAANQRQGQEIIKLLLNRRGDQVTITEAVVKAAAGYWKGKQMLELLLDRRGDQVPITEEVVKAAAANQEQGQEIIKLLLDRRGDQVPITEDVFKAAAANWKQCQEIIKLLLDRRGDQVSITEEVVKAAAPVCGKDTLELLLDRCRDQVRL